MTITQNNTGGNRADKHPQGDQETLLPLELTHIPGLVEDHTEYTESISRYPNRRTAFVGALAMLSFASGRRYRTEDNTRTNEYFVCYANSGAGKDAPRKTNKTIAVECGCPSCVADYVGSGEGLQDALLVRSKFLLQNDEFDTLIRAIAEDKGGTKESLVREFLSEFSSSGSMITKRSLSMSGKPSSSTKEFCIHPHFVFFGSAVGQYLFETFNDRIMENGLLARCLLVDCGKRQPRQTAKWRDVPPRIVDDYREILNSECKDGKYSIPDKPDEKNLPIIVEFTESATEEMERLSDLYDEEYNALNDDQHAAEQSFKARTGEHVTKMAMLYAISQNHLKPTISPEALDWADRFVRHCQESMIRNIERYTAANPHEANVKRIMRMLERRKTITKRDITKNLRLQISIVEEVIAYMITTGDLVEIDKDKGVYHAAK